VVISTEYVIRGVKASLSDQLLEAERGTPSAWMDTAGSIILFLEDVGWEALLYEEPIEIGAGYAEACDGYPQIFYLLDRGSVVGSIINIVKVTKIGILYSKFFIKIEEAEQVWRGSYVDHLWKRITNNIWKCQRWSWTGWNISKN